MAKTLVAEFGALQNMSSKEAKIMNEQALILSKEEKRETRQDRKQVLSDIGSSFNRWKKDNQGASIEEVTDQLKAIAQEQVAKGAVTQAVADALVKRSKNQLNANSGGQQ